MSASQDDQWYKDVVIYQLHVKAFYDSDGDGIGDFRGLLEKLDYLQWLGVSALWLLPFYPSPLRDDGYDVADYCNVHKNYGSMDDFRKFVQEAHARGMRVITEFVINHTSDQHPWFQRARAAPKGSFDRNYYVWSDSDKSYAGTRIIFTDTEKSNWTWDETAGQYYWHRFFRHQPDLNFENPLVMEEMLNVMRFWYDAGVDGLRLDAVPYICEREGTNNENLPETHDVIKKLRAVADAEYPDRFFLAEANQWPEDVRAYFGEFDECHMAFHFPLMPRLFLSIASQDRYPIYDIMQQTPPIPDGCQWAIFLRNHDEMTLEMLTDRERAFMYNVYAPETRARINVGIRRRLAPLMENDRRKIELLMSLLLSMPGTPIVYYGDELGMGDNIFLGDRDGVRTPMQWSFDRNGGFSDADGSALYLPSITDPLYGYTAVNVEAQRRSPSSLLQWLRRLIGVRQAHRVFGRGRINFLYPENRHVIAYIRDYQDEIVLCISNLSENSQPVTLDLGRYLGRTPVEMIGWSAFPPIVNEHYSFTLPGHAFFWFLLRPEESAQSDKQTPPAAPELTTLVLPRGWSGLLDSASLARLERTVLPPYLDSRHWIRERPISDVKVIDALPLSGNGREPLLVPVRTNSANQSATYLLALDRVTDVDDHPMTIARAAIARGRTAASESLIFDATVEDGFWIRVIEALQAGATIAGRSGTLECRAHPTLQDIEISAEPVVRNIPSERISGAVVDGSIFVKLYRQLEHGIHPEAEISQALLSAGYRHIAPLLGTYTYFPSDGEPLTFGTAYEFIESRGTGWEIGLNFLRRRLERRRTSPATMQEPEYDGFGGFVRYAGLLGERIAEFHRALASHVEDQAFAPQTYRPSEAKREVADLRAHIVPALAGLAKQDPIAVELNRRKREIHACIGDAAQALVGHERSRVHGNFVLDEVLVTAEDIVIIGLDGDLRLPLAERRCKRSPLTDVAAMLSSFDDAATAVSSHLGADRTESAGHFEPLIVDWLVRARKSFLDGYERASGKAINPVALGFFQLEAALRSLELEHDPLPSLKIAGPAQTVLRLLNAHGEQVT